MPRGSAYTRLVDGSRSSKGEYLVRQKRARFAAVGESPLHPRGDPSRQFLVEYRMLLVNGWTGIAAFFHKVRCSPVSKFNDPHKME